MLCVNLSSAPPLRAAAVVLYRALTFCLPVVPWHDSVLAWLCSAPLPTSPSLLWCSLLAFPFQILGWLAAFPVKMLFGAPSSALARPACRPRSRGPRLLSPWLPSSLLRTCPLRLRRRELILRPARARSYGSGVEGGRAWPQRWCQLPEQGKWVSLGFEADIKDIKVCGAIKVPCYRSLLPSAGIPGAVPKETDGHRPFCPRHRHQRAAITRPVAVRC